MQRPESIEEFINKIKREHDIDSDYGMAKILRLTRQALSAHRSKRAKHFSEETVYRMGELTNEDPAYALVVLAAERAKDEKVREAWRRVAQIMRSSTPIIFVALFLSIFVPTKPALADSGFSVSHNTTHYTLCVRRWLKKWRTCLLSWFWCRLSPHS